MAEIVGHLPIDNKLKTALCREPNNEYAPLLRLAQCFEDARWPDVDAMVQQLDLDKAKVMEAFRSLIDDVHARIISQNALFRTVGIKVRLEDFTTLTRAKSRAKYTNEKAVMEEYVRNLFSEFEVSRKKFRLVGVRVSNLKTTDKAQETILNWAKS